MPKDYVVPNVDENFQQRLQSITEQILSRSRLLHIRDELNLYTKGRFTADAGRGRRTDEKGHRSRAGTRSQTTVCRHFTFTIPRAIL